MGKHKGDKPKGKKGEKLQKKHEKGKHSKGDKHLKKGFGAEECGKKYHHGKNHHGEAHGKHHGEHPGKKKHRKHHLDADGAIQNGVRKKRSGGKDDKPKDSKKEKGSASSASDSVQFCTQCKKHCPLTDPKCGNGRRLAEEMGIS